MHTFHYFRQTVVASLCLLSVHANGQTVANVTSMSAEQKAAATSIKLTGTPTLTGNSDFRQMRDLCFKLRSVDLSEADCKTIPDNAFHSRHQLEEVTLPNKLEIIGTQAFFACTSLKRITIPASVIVVGNTAFSSCSSLQEIVIEGEPTIEPFAFARLNNLRAITVKSAIPPRAMLDAFYGVDFKNVRLVVPKGAEKAYREAPTWKQFYEGEISESVVCNPETALVPVPAELKVINENIFLQVYSKWTVEADDDLQNEKEHALRILDERIGEKECVGKATMRLSIDPALTDDEAYTLDVNSKGVTIKGRTAAGVFYGLMTFDQLLNAGKVAKTCVAIPELHIADQPRTHIRELMLDPCRIFVPFEDIMAFVPQMARYKLNALHLHLVDDQAWRIEIKKYPRLTEMSSSRVGMDDMQMPISGYYTQDQMRQLVAYAAKYHVQVVPEIEMPGHEVAAIHAYPELTCHAKEVPLRTTCGVSNELLCPGNEFTFKFLNDVFDELADVFTSPYIHLGGDEAGNPALDCWTSCPKCQALKKQLGITTTDRSENWRLQEYMFNRVIKYLRSEHGKTPMFWYELDFKTIQPGCVTFAWRAGLTKEALDAAVANNARIMLCPGEHCYFDYPMAKGDMPEVNWGMPTTTLKDTYSLDPAWGMGEEFEKNNLFGVAGTLWSECINSTERIYYQAYPRALALAEVGWSPASKISWKSFGQRLRHNLFDMMRRGICFSMQFDSVQ